MESHLELGQFYFGRGQYVQAIEQYRAQLGEDPHCVVSFAMIAASHINLKQTKQADRAIREALALDPEYAFAHYIRSLVHLQRFQMVRAEREIREALRIEATPGFLRQAATIAMLRGSHADALDLVDDALALNPEDAATFTLRGKILVALGRIEEAHQVFRSALAENPEDADAHQALGELKLREQESTAALDQLREARRLDPIDSNNPDAIGTAHGRTIWPFKLLTPLVFNWLRLSVARRSLLVLTLAAVLVPGGFWVSHVAAQFPAAMTAWRGFCITVASLVILPLSFDFAAMAVGSIALRREFGHGRVGIVRVTGLFGLFLAIQGGAIVLGWNIADPWRAATFCLGCALIPNLLQTIRSPMVRLQGPSVCSAVAAGLVWSSHGKYQFDDHAVWARPAILAFLIAAVYLVDAIVQWAWPKRTTSPNFRNL